MRVVRVKNNRNLLGDEMLTVFIIWPIFLI